MLLPAKTCVHMQIYFKKDITTDFFIGISLLLPDPNERQKCSTGPLLLMCTCYHKIYFLLNNWEKMAYSNFCGLSLVALISY